MSKHYIFKLWVALERRTITEREALLDLLEHLAIGTKNEDVANG